eukprot:437373-Alexandrium_andersonii.AAC.1
MRKLQHRFKRSEPELCGPRNRLKVGTRSSRGVRSAQPFRADSESANESRDGGGPKPCNREHRGIQSTIVQCATRAILG